MKDKNRSLEGATLAILFAYGEPITIKRLAKILGKSEAALREVIVNLKERLRRESGLVIVERDREFQLVSAKDYSDLIEKLFKDVHREELSRASLETLAICAYEGPISRYQIEQIRGVNSVYTIRGLLLRGLIEKTTDHGEIRYDLSFEAARKFGLDQREDLPEWGEIRRQIAEAKEALIRIDESRTKSI